MKKKLLFATVMIAIVVLLMGSSWAEEKAKEAGPTAKYVGVDACKGCHKTKKSGDQFGIWSAGPHKKAFDTLASEESAAIAKKMGLKTSAQGAPECLICHATAFGVKPDLVAKEPLSMENGVSCEGCHGAGSLYKKLSIMKDREKAVAAGLVEIDAASCTGCHNEKSPTFKGFEFETWVKKINHPTPKPEPEKG